MRNFENYIVKISIIHNLLQIITAVPPDYCLQSLNSSDCNEPAAYVFSYYKPGSRCEIEEWRGCPTANRFDSEEDCVNTCIYRFGGGNNNDIVLSGVDSDFNIKKEICKEPLRIDICTDNFTLAFVYKKDENKCTPITWYGCPHIGNVFEEELDCLQTCHQGDLDWEEIMKKMSAKLKDQIESILDNVAIDKLGNQTKQTNKASTETTKPVTPRKILLSKVVTVKYKPIDINTKNEIAKDRKVIFTTTKKVITTKKTKDTKNIKTEAHDRDENKSIPDIKENLIENISTEGSRNNIGTVTVSFSPTESMETTKQKTTDLKEHVTESETIFSTRLISTTSTTTTRTEVTSQSTTSTMTSPRRKRTTPTQIGTAKAVVLIQDV